MPKKDSLFIQLLKTHSGIDISFINLFFKNFKIGGELEFDIRDSVVAKYLNINLRTLRDRLQNTYAKTEQYIKNVDYIKIKPGKDSTLIYYLNYPCFEKIAMESRGPRSESIRLYFIKLRQFIVENQNTIYQAIHNRDNLHQYIRMESIYFIVIDKRRSSLVKIGRSRDIIQRLRNYNVGRIDEVDLKYYAIVKNSIAIENCLKSLLKKNQFYENREIYKINHKKLKDVIYNCYKKNVNVKENKELYDDLSAMLGVYSFTKNDSNFEPFVIIGKNIK